jgi:hypothetical protein
MRLSTAGAIATPPIKVDTLIFDYSNWSISVILRSGNISICEKNHVITNFGASPYTRVDI